MLSIVLLSIGIPCIVAAAFAGLRRRMPALVADIRGLALQTVIIMVVLLAIAGAIAAVLVTRGGEAVDEVEGVELGNLNTQELCEGAGRTWTATTTANNPTMCAR